jgi:hypothetical protein
MESGCRRVLKGFSIRVGKSIRAQLILMVLGCVADLCDSFSSSMITYPNYKFYFPIKALGMYMKRYGDEELFC